MRKRLRNWVPSREQVFSIQPMHYFKDHLSAHDLWHLNRRSVTGGVAVGLFFAFVTPIAQIPFAALVAYWFRVNIPVAFLTTFVNNPVTFPFVYLICYRIGLAILGEPAEAASGWSPDWFLTHLQPIFLGALLVGTAAAGGGYFIVRLLWRLDIQRRWDTRRRRRAQRRARH